MLRRRTAPAAYVPLCWLCKHYGSGSSPNMCTAFPDGIPPDILLHRHDHRKPFAGDRDFGFEAVTEAAAAYAEEIFSDAS